MKKIKYLFITLTFIFFATIIYQNYIYYTISNNSLSKRSVEPITCSVTDYNPNLSENNSENSKFENTSNSKDCSAIFKYLKDLNLKPMKSKDFDYSTMNLRYDIRLDSPDNDNLTILVWLDDLSSIYIDSEKPDLPRGYYKIINSEFNYKYINNLIANSEE